MNKCQLMIWEIDLHDKEKLVTDDEMELDSITTDLKKLWELCDRLLLGLPSVDKICSSDAIKHVQSQLKTKKETMTAYLLALASVHGHDWYSGNVKARWTENTKLHLKAIGYAAILNCFSPHSFSKICPSVFANDIQFATDTPRRAHKVLRRICGVDEWSLLGRNCLQISP